MSLPALRNDRGGNCKYFISEDTVSLRRTCGILVGDAITEMPRVVRIDNE